MDNYNCADVTAIIPYFKDSNTIYRAVTSIMNQTLLPKKVFIIDDCSNENNSILKKIEEEFSIIEVIYLTQNVGPGEARNKGIELADTKYIAFLDSDDTWAKHKIEKQLQYMEATNAFISSHESEIYGSIKKKREKTNKINIITPLKQLLKNRLATRAVMMKNPEKYRFKKGKRRAEDFLLWSQIILDGHKAIKINETLAYSYKEHYGENGLTANINKMYEGAIDAINTLRKEKKINNFTFLFLVILQTLKQVIRFIKLKLRKIKLRS